MIDMERFNAALAKYIADFPRRWHDDGEYYKWEAVKHFQDNWDVDAKDFADMLSRSLAKTANLLANANNFPAGMITEFARTSPEDVRAMFLQLYDESLDLFFRIILLAENRLLSEKSVKAQKTTC